MEKIFHSKGSKWNFEKVVKFVDLYGGGTQLASTEFLNVDNKMKFLCRCGKTYDASFYQFRKYKRITCRSCSGVNSWDYSQTKKLFKENGLEPLFEAFEGPVPAKKKLPALNSKGYRVCVAVDKLKSGKKPDSFSKFNPYTISNIKKFINDNAPGFRILSSSYFNNYSPLDWECPSNHAFTSSWREFQQGNRCPVCNHSKGEEVIKKWLDSKGVVYEREFQFEDLRGHRNRKLRFDFAVLHRDGFVKLLIEYDGEMHFKTTRFHKTAEEAMAKLKRTQHNDKVKNQYALENGIQLLRIPYTQYKNIEKILALHL